MAFCSKCGQPIEDDAKFCASCGATVGSNSGERQTVYEGKVHKCPNCGAVLQSFVAVCPVCGYEVRNADTPQTLQEFANNVSWYERLIANTPQAATGWSSWSGTKQVLWVLLNIAFLGIPLVIYLVLPLVKLRSNPKLSSEEQQLTSYIENFPFPNDRESILATLIYIKDKIDFLSKGKISRKTSYWMNIWSAKAEQIKQKADMLLPGDGIVAQSYSEIYADRIAVKKRIKAKQIVGVSVALLSLTVCTYIIGSRVGVKPVQSLARTYEIKNYVGRNLASIGECNLDYKADKYGEGELRLVFVTESGMIIPADNEEIQKQYTVVKQSIDAGTELKVTYQDNSYMSLVDYQSFDEIILYASQIGDNSHLPAATKIFPTEERGEYHIRDYVGRNAAAFGDDYLGARIDKYGEGELRLTFTLENGEFVEADDIDSLKAYIVVSQDIEPNEELKFEYETYRFGMMKDYHIVGQNYEEINLTVRKIDASIVAQMPELDPMDSETDSDDSYVELTIEYTVLGNNKAIISGFRGDGNHVTIDKKIDGHEVVGIGESAFKDCITLKSVLFWADIDVIEDYAFAGCTALESISIPTETTEIGDHAFEGCTNLSSLHIWGSPSIGEYAFAGCTSITSVSISLDTKGIGEHAFDGCTNLESVHIWDDDTIVGKDAFANCPKLKDRPVQK